MADPGIVIDYPWADPNQLFYMLLIGKFNGSGCRALQDSLLSLWTYY